MNNNANSNIKKGEKINNNFKIAENKEFKSFKSSNFTSNSIIIHTINSIDMIINVNNDLIKFQSIFFIYKF